MHYSELFGVSSEISIYWFYMDSDLFHIDIRRIGKQIAEYRDSCEIRSLTDIMLLHLLIPNVRMWQS